jgi:hypothetical protein
VVGNDCGKSAEIIVVADKSGALPPALIPAALFGLSADQLNSKPTKVTA